MAGTYLDKIMKERGISNSMLGRLCGVSPQAARHWRLGVWKPKVAYAKKIASTLDIPRHLLRPDIWEPPKLLAAREARRRRRVQDEPARRSETPPAVPVSI